MRLHPVPQSKAKHTGFTIVELLIVIIVIAILAAISIVAYNGIQTRARVTEVGTGLVQTKKKLELYKVDASNYPSTGNLSAAGVIDNNVVYQYTSDGSTYCLTGTVDSIAYKVTATTSPIEGVCLGHTIPSESGGAIADGAPIQTITSANCPTARTRAVDARDNHTYWIQKLGDGKCWMLTNLGYIGGGASTYSDTRSLVNGTSDPATFTVASYYIIPSTTSYTTEPTSPSLSESGTGQYGYLYNWCGAMGAQAATNACTNAATPTASPNTTICPAGWRLPSGNGGEFGALNAALNNNSTSGDTGLRSSWLAQRSGAWYSGFNGQGSAGYYWSSTQHSAAYAYDLGFSTTSSIPADAKLKSYAFAVRCVAS